MPAFLSLANLQSFQSSGVEQYLPEKMNHIAAIREAKYLKQNSSAKCSLPRQKVVGQIAARVANR